MAIGRPRLWETPDQLLEAAEVYFLECERKAEAKPEDFAAGIPTVNGLCLAIGCVRETLWDYSKKPGFSNAVKEIRARLEVEWEKRLLYPNATGAIFWLKNQGWTDKSEVSVEANVKAGVTYQANLPKRD